MFSFPRVGWHLSLSCIFAETIDECPGLFLGRSTTACHLSESTSGRQGLNVLNPQYPSRESDAQNPLLLVQNQSSVEQDRLDSDPRRSTWHRGQEVQVRIGRAEIYRFTQGVSMCQRRER